MVDSKVISDNDIEAFFIYYTANCVIVSKTGCGLPVAWHVSAISLVFLPSLHKRSLVKSIFPFIIIIILIIICGCYCNRHSNDIKYKIDE